MTFQPWYRLLTVLASWLPHGQDPHLAHRRAAEIAALLGLPWGAPVILLYVGQ